MSVPKITIKVGVKTKLRRTDQWRMTTTATELFVINTDLDNYGADITVVLTGIDTYVSQMHLQGAEVGCHYSINLENVTAAPAYTGSITQAKANFDGGLTPEEFTVLKLYDQLTYTITSILHTSKYDSESFS